MNDPIVVTYRDLHKASDVMAVLSRQLKIYTLPQYGVFDALHFAIGYVRQFTRLFTAMARCSATPRIAAEQRGSRGIALLDERAE